MKKEKDPKLEKCYECQGKTFEYEDGFFGCDSCKAVWVLTEQGWINIKENNKKDERRTDIRN